MKPLDYVPKDHTSLKIGQVPKYLKARFALEVSRQTVYNWLNSGKRQETLKYARITPPTGSHYAFIQVTTHEWLDDFIRRSGLLVAPIEPI